MAWSEEFCSPWGRAMGAARAALLSAAAILGTLTARPAAADTDLFGRDTLSGLLDLRTIAADGEDSYLRGGFGKTQASGGGADVAVRPTLDLAAVAWRPELVGDLAAYVTAQAQPYQTHPVDVGEAFLLFRPVPTSDLRFGIRAGLMWPPASLEHDGPAWTLTRTLTPSALDTWIAEEVKVLAVEGSVSRDLGGHRLSATAAVFGDNDASGALLAYRGWALSDVRTALFSAIPAPAWAGSATPYQTRPSEALDARPGGYASLEWRPPAPVALKAFVYDNNADPGTHRGDEWAWRTAFADLGLTARPAEGIEVLAQALSGRTYYGQHADGLWTIDEDFDAAYLLATRVAGANRFTLRADWFEVTDRPHADPADFNERGRALTGDYAFALTSRLSLWIEAMRVWSRRSERVAAGEAAGQGQGVLQLAIRASL